jgi:hypothetical protein
LPLHEKRAKANDKNRQAKEGLATHFITLGQVNFHQLRDAEAAEEAIRNAIRIREDLVKADGDSVPYQMGLADSHKILGDMLLHLRGKALLAVVREEYTIAHEMETKLYQRNRSNEELKRGLASSYYRLGTIDQLSEKKEESQKQFRECLRLREELAKADQKNLYKQVELALVQARCGDVEKAAASAKRFRTDAAKDGGILYYIGGCFALCAAATEEPSKRTEYAGEAVATLRQAVARGYNDRVSLETDPDLESLQGIPEYKEMVQQLKQH